jgi:hypothetical protein
VKVTRGKIISGLLLVSISIVWVLLLTIAQANVDAVNAQLAPVKATVEAWGLRLDDIDRVGLNYTIPDHRYETSNVTLFLSDLQKFHVRHLWYNWAGIPFDGIATLRWQNVTCIGTTNQFEKAVGLGACASKQVDELELVFPVQDASSLFVFGAVWLVVSLGIIIMLRKGKGLLLARWIWLKVRLFCVGALGTIRFLRGRLSWRGVGMLFARALASCRQMTACC